MASPVVGLLSVELYVPHARSLKDKRAVLRRVKDRLQPRNLAIAEVAYQDVWQRAGLAVVAVGSTRVMVERTLEDAVTEIERRDPGVIAGTALDWLS